LDLLNHVLLLRRIVVGTVAFVVGLAMVIGANRIFRDLGTNVRPSQPTPALATKGMYTWTRNPMYVGGGIALLGIAIDWVPLLLALSGPLLHYGIILREGAIWKASLATNTGATRPGFHVIGGDSEARGKAYR
jgi:protein-S-isoprenylcysteine O-methyltransferase Ste14